MVYVVTNLRYLSIQVFAILVKAKTAKTNREHEQRVSLIRLIQYLDWDGSPSK